MLKSYKDLKDLFTAKEKIKILSLFGFNILSSLTDVLSIGLLIPLLNIILDNSDKIYYINFINQYTNLINPENFLPFLLLSFLFLIILKNLFTIFFTWYQVNFTVNLDKSLKNKIYQYYMRRDYNFLVNFHTSEIFKNVDFEVSVFMNNYLAPLIFIITNSFLVLSFAIFLLFFNFEITLFIVLTLSIIALIFKIIFSKRLIRWGYERQDLQKKRFKLLKETFDIIKEIKLLKLNSYFSNRFSELMNTLNKLAIYRAIAYVVIKPSVEIIFLSIFILMLLFNLDNPQALLVTIGVYAATLFRLMPAFNSIMQNYQKFDTGRSSIEKIQDTVIKSKKLDLINISTLKKDEIKFNQKIQLQNITYSYEGSKNTILQKINFDISYKEKIGIVGPSGSGKTSLINLIIGLIKPIQGSVLIDNLKLDSEEKISSWQNNIGYVPQSVILLDKSLKENVTMCFDRELNSEEEKRFQKAIEFSQLQKVNEKINMDKKLSIGEGGYKISKGEGQRIGIARAIYRNCKVLILDEATNFLDENTEREFLKIIDSEMIDMTLIFVSHKLSSLKTCHKIFEIENKQLKIKQ